LLSLQFGLFLLLALFSRLLLGFLFFGGDLSGLLFGVLFLFTFLFCRLLGFFLGSLLMFALFCSQLLSF
jgi:hypothetical protein